MDWTRSSGILLHPTSLPGRFGIGDLGRASHQWIDFLVQSGQKLWQVLPLGPTGFADSPYACFSSFAGNPLLIALDKLAEMGLLEEADLADAPRFPGDQVDYGAVIRFKRPLLEKAASRFLTGAAPTQRAAFEGFCQKESAWLEDFALFAALKRRFNDAIWYDWDPEIALRQPAALAHYTRELAGQVAVQKVLQFVFLQQWCAIKACANAHGIQIVGDVPIFVAPDSADVWSNSDLFYLDERGRPTLVSGVPPDYFSETGQRWGNPLYRWDAMAKRGYAWWIARIVGTLCLVDIIRIDHFRGFSAYWEIPASEPTAVRGRWVPGPGQALFDAIKLELGAEQRANEPMDGPSLPILAEDLGVITPEVIELRERFGFPGMKILQFAFDENALRASFGEHQAGEGQWRNPFLPHNYTPDFVVYTGTHDNDTALGWFHSCSQEERQKAVAYLGITNDKRFNWALIRAAMASVAQFAIVPLQDVLGLSSEARMNLPGTVGSNWRWRCPPHALTDEIAARLGNMVRLYER